MMIFYRQFYFLLTTFVNKSIA